MDNKFTLCVHHDKGDRHSVACCNELRNYIQHRPENLK